MSQDSVQFSDHALGSPASCRVFNLVNEGSYSVNFEFLIDKSSVFCFSPKSSVIRPRSTCLISVTFNPRAPINYYRKVSCLVENGETSYIDVLATCFSNEVRPATLNMRHIKFYEQKSKLGYGHIGPNEIKETFDSGSLFFKDLSGSLEKEICATHPSTNLVHKPIEFALNTIDFEIGSKYKFSNSKGFAVKNNFSEPVICHWQINPAFNAFVVDPVVKEIPANRSYEFRVFFRPAEEEKYYQNTIEGYVYFKNSRNFRLVSDENLTPPFFIPISLVGYVKQVTAAII